MKWLGECCYRMTPVVKLLPCTTGRTLTVTCTKLTSESSSVSTFLLKVFDYSFKQQEMRASFIRMCVPMFRIGCWTDSSGFWLVSKLNQTSRVVRFSLRVDWGVRLFSFMAHLNKKASPTVTIFTTTKCRSFYILMEILVSLLAV